MPTHFSTGTKVHLATVPLASTTTITPQMKKSAHATSLVDQTEETFINCSEILREDNIPCMGEDSRLHWIGPNSDMPFMMVQAGAELFKTGIANPPKQALRSGSRRDLAPEPSPSRELPGEYESESSLSSVGTTPSPIEPQWFPHQDTTDGATEKEAVEGVAAAGRATGRSVSHLMSAVTGAKPEPAHASESLLAQEKFRNTGPPLADFGPYGLALRLELTNKSFVPPYEPGAVVDDIKIEVFFNGEFSHATLMPSRYRTETKRGSELFKYFSGLRTHFMLERAWIIRAATRYADGSSRVPNAEARASALQRWQQMAASLQNEADTRGFNKWGDRTVMGEYLTSLAKLPMPEELQSLKRMGDLTYGVIDVVLTYGKGKKAESSEPYLLKPGRMRDAGFEPRAPTGALLQPAPLPGIFHGDRSFNSSALAARQDPTDIPNASPRQRSPRTPPPADENDLPELPVQGMVRSASQIVPAISESSEGTRTLPRNQSFDTAADDSEIALTSPGMPSTESGIGFNNLFSSPADGHHTRGHIRPMGGMFEQPSQSLEPSSPIPQLESLSISQVDPNLPNFQPAELELEPARHLNSQKFFPTEYMTALSRNRALPSTLPFPDFSETTQQEGAELEGDGLNAALADAPAILEHSRTPSVELVANQTNAEASGRQTSLPSSQGLLSSHSMLPPPLAPPKSVVDLSVERSLRRRSSALDLVPEEVTPRKKTRQSVGASQSDSGSIGGALGITRRGLFTQAGSSSDRSPKSLRFGSNDNIDPGVLGTLRSPHELQFGPRLGAPPSSANEAMPTSSVERLDPLGHKLVKRVIIKNRGKLVRDFTPSNPMFLSKSLPAETAAGAPPAVSGTTLHPAPALPPTPSQTSPIKPTPSRGPALRRSTRRNPTTTTPNIEPSPSLFPAPSITPAVSSSPFKDISPEQKPRASAPIFPSEKSRTHDSSSQDKPLAVPSQRPRNKATPFLTNPKHSRTNRTKERKAASQRLNGGLEQEFWNFVEPVGSRGCVVGYAMPRVGKSVGEEDDSDAEGEGECKGGAGGEVVRQIKCERGGEFGEEGVVLGVRFLVGG